MNLYANAGPQVEKSLTTAALVMVNAATVFTIANGAIVIVDLLSECITANDATASTLQWQSVPTVGSAATISGATTTLASIAAGATIRAASGVLATAPTIALAAAGGVQAGQGTTTGITVQPGTLKLVIAIGSTTGTWKHSLRYKPLNPSVIVTG